MDRPVALVTGGSRGIGAATARRLAADGMDVAITYQRAVEHADKTVAEIEATGARALAIQTDLTERSSPAFAIRQAIEHLSRLDVIVGNAGTAPHGPIDDVSPDLLEDTWSIHVRANFELAQEAVRHMPDGGRIVFVGSNLAERTGGPGWALYAMCKAALAGLARGLARDLGPRGITVNVVSPGSTDTDLNPADAPEADEERAVTALGRYLDPEEIAATVAHLASPAAGGITGSTILVDAGANA